MANGYNNDYKNEENKDKDTKENGGLISNKLLSDNLDLEISLEKVPF